MQIIHRDLAARNVLDGEIETCKVTDFGMAIEMFRKTTFTKKDKDNERKINNISITQPSALHHNLFSIPNLKV